MSAVSCPAERERYKVGKSDGDNGLGRTAPRPKSGRDEAAAAGGGDKKWQSSQTVSSSLIIF